MLKKLFCKVRVVSARYDNRNEILTVVYDNGAEIKYSGDGTVWHYYPMMKRCPTSVEIKLYEIWAYIKEHGNPYPDAHKKLRNRNLF